MRGEPHGKRVKTHVRSMCATPRFARGSPTFHAKRNPSRAAAHFRSETRFIIVHVGSTWVFDFHARSTPRYFLLSGRNEPCGLLHERHSRFALKFETRAKLNIIVEVCYYKSRLSQIRFLGRWGCRGRRRASPSPNTRVYVVRQKITFYSLKDSSWQFF